MRYAPLAALATLGAIGTANADAPTIPGRYQIIQHASYTMIDGNQTGPVSIEFGILDTATGTVYVCSSEVKDGSAHNKCFKTFSLPPS
jgi:hypothetical protein